MVNIDVLSKFTQGDNPEYGVYLKTYQCCTDCGVTIHLKLFTYGIKGCLIVPKCLKDIISITINLNESNSIGPILFWLATSPEWERGERQNTTNSNNPYCAGPGCNLLSPPGTPDVNCIIGKKTFFSYLFLDKYYNYNENFYKNFVKNGIVIFGKLGKKKCFSPCDFFSNSLPGLNIIDKATFQYVND